ncbi:galactokinase [Spirochaeta thermophila DSM 6578]|uniref:Galactokinase n=1 Tax=Winmispira thermophila (strain ATCC 700085 / DSM 6578 / Z-1203) TaxID=869211 RepID=G0GE16_WINT7|nr:galactokinase [Spirochaeta thermophila]AEJ60648.1 galactokinase [Spirochaeta thermophila DSM 6578]
MRFRAPGRVNIIGEHTDYNDGFVLPFAIDRWIEVEVEPSDRWVVWSERTGEEVPFSPDERRGDWSDYVAGVVWALRKRGLSLRRARLLVRATLPDGAGLSSSAALEVATGAAVCAASGYELDRDLLVEAAWEAENEFVGMRCGIMDQFVVAHGREGHALLLDTHTREFRLVPISLPGAEFFLVNSGVKHELASSGYNTRRAECAAVLERLGKGSFREVRPEEVDGLPDPLRRRARHVLTENERVMRTVDALERGDVAEVGRLLSASHRSLRDDYEVSCEEIDWLVERVEGVEGVYGARMVGGGFGGSVLVLAREGVADGLEGVLGEYGARWGVEAGVLRVRSADGVGRVD